MPEKPGKYYTPGVTGTHYRHNNGEHTLTVALRGTRPGVAITSYGPGGFRVHNLAPTCVRELVDTLLACLKPCGGVNSNVCVAEGCHNEECVR
jgi:hypothetical protein